MSEQNPESRIQNPEGEVGGTRPHSGFWILNAGFCLLAAALGGCYAYYTLFSTFRTWDDEGYVMLTIRFFNEGYPLYDDVYSQYGPFFYFVNWLIFRPAGLAIGSDNIRFVTLAFWLATALVSAIVVWRLTRSALLALLTQVLVTIHLNIADEPGHPQGLACMLAVIVPLLATFYRPDRSHWVWLGLGACAGLLVMTKVNLGIFLLVALALLLFCGGGRFDRGIGLGVVVAALLLPALLMRAHIDETYVRNYCMTVALALVPAILILWRRERALASSRRDQVAVVLAAAITIAGITGLTCLHGTRLAAVLDGVLLQHARFSTTFRVFVPFEVWSLLIAGGGLLVYQRASDARLRLAAKQLSWLKLFFGVAVFALALLRQPTLLLTCALPFLWLTLIGESDDERVFPRALLVLWTLVQSLQAYPVGGTQLVCATFLLIVNAAVCLHDAIAELPGFEARSGAVVRVLLGVAALGVLGQLTITRARNYGDLAPLDLPGARRLRLPAEDVATYRRLTADLVQHADTFFTMPGMNSFYFWSEIDPPTHLNTTTWMTLFDADRQRKIVEAFAQRPRACVIRNEQLVLFWLRGQKIESLPLVVAVEDDFATIDRVGDYEFRVRRPMRD